MRRSYSLGIERDLLMERLRSKGLEARLRAADVKLTELAKQYEAVLRKQLSEEKRLGMELDKTILADALLRENRAKAALREVLTRQGVPETAIETIMEAIDSNET
jgi:hypothetical protein